MAILIGTRFHDALSGTSGDDRIKGLGFADYILTGHGDDYVNPGRSIRNGDLIVIDGSGSKTLDFSTRKGGEGSVYVNFILYSADLETGHDVFVDGASNYGYISRQGSGDVTFVNVKNALETGKYGGLTIQTGDLGIPSDIRAGHELEYLNDRFWLNPGENAKLTILPGGGRDEIHIGKDGFVELNYDNLDSGITVLVNLGVIMTDFDVGDDGKTMSFDTISGPGRVGAIRTTPFDDKVYGATGRDQFTLLSGNDYANGFSGDDLVRYDRFEVDTAHIDLTTGMATGTTMYGPGFTHTLRNIEDIRGSDDSDDTIIGNGRNNTLEGIGGNDRLVGRGGDDELIGGDRGDKLNGGVGDDRLEGQNGADTFIFQGDFGADTIVDFNAASGNEDIHLRRVSTIMDFSDLVANHLSQVGANVVIDAGSGNTVTLLNTSLADLDQTDFIF